MNHLRIIPLLLAATAVLSACADDPVTPSSDTDGWLRSAVAQPTNEYLVVFETSTIPAGFAQQVAALGGSVENAFEAVGAAAVSGLDAAGVAGLQAVAGVLTVEPETQLRLPSAKVKKAPAAAVLPSSQANPAGAFFYARQWNLRAIHADAAWAAGKLGDEDVVVGILDTGIDYRHADLAGRVDLARSVSFVPEDDAYVQYYFPGAHPIADIGFHGTHVAATVVSNGLAAAGVTSKTTLLGVKICSVALGFCPGNAVFAGIEYAVEQRADIINMSLGSSFQKRAYPGYVAVVNRMFAWAHRMGVTVVVAAGNEGIDLDHAIVPKDGELVHVPGLYKTYCSTPNNICVSATGPTAYSLEGPWTNPDAPASYTTYGRSAIDVAAPGGDFSYVFAACSSFSLVIPVCQTGTFIVGATGTSMASPHVAGVAALIMAQRGGHLAPAHLRNALVGSADDLGQRGTDPFYGKGRVNAARAVGAAF